MRKIIQFADLNLLIKCKKECSISTKLKQYLKEDNEHAEIKVDVCEDWEKCRHPVSEAVGEDLVQLYYKEGDTFFCELKGGNKGAFSCTQYKKDYKYFQCILNQNIVETSLYSLDKIIRMLPMRSIFTMNDILFFHASQIIINNVGILFTAPSGTGKSTQARLWERYERAKIICNDRTLVRKIDSVWKTYGYPMDGSDPVFSNQKGTLGCIVLLEQGLENKVEKYSRGKTIAYLMEQMVMDTWDMDMRNKVIEILIQLIKDIPVYVFTCTPDIHAVQCLKQQLMKDGVIINED